jgi:hypothetical protein
MLTENEKAIAAALNKVKPLDIATKIENIVWGRCCVSIGNALAEQRDGFRVETFLYRCKED